MQFTFTGKDKFIIDLLTETVIQHNIDGYLVGGYVRDKLLNRQSMDIDVVCVGDGIDFAQKFAKLCPKASRVNVFKSFGTAQVVVEGFEVEFDWLGYGKRTVYLEAPFAEHEYHNFTAIGLKTVTREFGAESVTTLQVKYSDIAGNTQSANELDLVPLLESAFANAL